jgi:arsenate reductase-like glutaredoxin family protein
MALACAALLAAGCRRQAPAVRGEARLEGAEAAPRVPFEVRRDSSDLTFFWFDGHGNAHGVARVDDVPEASRANVRVEPPQPEQRTPGWVFVADLRAPGPDGRFPVRVVQSEQFATELGALTGQAPTIAAPSAPAVPPGTPAILAPGAPSGQGAHGGAGTQQPRVVVYGAEWCSACHQAAGWLRANNIPFVEHDIEREPQAAQEMLARARAQGVPTGSIPIIDVGGRLLVGFNPEAIQQALRGG